MDISFFETLHILGHCAIFLRPGDQMSPKRTFPQLMQSHSGEHGSLTASILFHCLSSVARRGTWQYSQKPVLQRTQMMRQMEGFSEHCLGPFETICLSLINSFLYSVEVLELHGLVLLTNVVLEYLRAVSDHIQHVSLRRVLWET